MHKDSWKFVNLSLGELKGLFGKPVPRSTPATFSSGEVKIMIEGHEYPLERGLRWQHTEHIHAHT